MTVGINSVWECRASATASNVNGAGFNPENANMLTDLTTDANTGNTSSPVVSSASYNFVAGDVNAYVFIQSGTNWSPGWYKIASVASNKATLTAGTGVSVRYTSGAARSFFLSTSAGVATVGTPTSGTFAIDYSQQDAAIIAGVADFAATGSSTTLTSATAGFTKAMTGNFYHQTTTGTGAFGVVGWYEIVSVTNGTTVVLDRTPNSGTASVACTGYVGGAASLQTSSGATDDSFFENGAGTNTSGAHVFFIKNGTFTMNSSPSIAAAGGTAAPIRVIGYNSLRTDGLASNLEENRPTLNFAGNTFTTTGTNWEFYNLNFKGTIAAGSIITAGQGNRFIRCKVVHNGTTGGRCFSFGAVTVTLIEVEAVSCRSNVILTSNTGVNLQLDSCYFHDSVVAISTGMTTGRTIATNCIFAHNITRAFDASGVWAPIHSLFLNCTFYGAEQKLWGGINIGATNETGTISVKNCLFYGLVDPIVGTTTQFASSGMSGYNNYFNNTNSNTNFPEQPNTTAVNPSFVSVVERSGSTATTGASNTFTQSGATFQTWGITAGTDFLVIISGTGTTNGISYSIQSVDSETQLTLGETTASSATADHVWSIVQGRNFGIGAAARGIGTPGAFPGNVATGYPDSGAVQSSPTIPVGILYMPNMEGT